MIEQLIHAVENHLLLVQSLAFLVAFLESLAIVGTIIPGSVTMLPFGLMLGSGKLPIGSTLAIIVAGAFIGDYVSFLVGCHYKERINDWKWFKKRPEWLSKGRYFIEHHGGKSIIIGRFFGPLRSSVPLLAGALKMGHKSFVMAAIPSVTMWAIIYLCPGYILAAWGAKLGWAHWIALASIITLIILFVAQQFCQRIIFSLTQNKFLTLPEHLVPICWIVLILCTIYALLASSVSLGYVDSLNTLAHQTLDIIRTPISNKISTVFSISGDKKTLFLMCVFGALTLLIQKQYRLLILLIVPIVCQVTLVEASKLLTACQRPISHVVQNIHSYSFPSGHISAVAVLSYAICQVALINQPARMRLIAAISLSLWTAFVLLSQLILEVHWVFDLIGALIVFGITSCLLKIIIETLPPIKEKLSQTTIVLLVCSGLLSQALMIYIQYNSGRYLLHQETPCHLQTQATL